MKYGVPPDVGAVSIAGRSYTVDPDGTIDVHPDVARDHADHLAAHGLTPAPAIETPADMADPDKMGRREMYAWLKAHGIPGLLPGGDKALREKIKAIQATLEKA